MLMLNKTMDQLARANSVRCHRHVLNLEGHVLRRGHMLVEGVYEGREDVVFRS